MRQCLLLLLLLTVTTTTTRGASLLLPNNPKQPQGEPEDSELTHDSETEWDPVDLPESDVTSRTSLLRAAKSLSTDLSDSALHSAAAKLEESEFSNVPFEDLATSKVTVAMTSWNRADASNRKAVAPDAHAVYANLDVALNWERPQMVQGSRPNRVSPTILAISFQELKASEIPTSLDSALAHGLELLTVSYGNSPWAHGKTGVAVFVSPKVRFKLGGFGRFRTKDAEKSMSVVFIEIADKIVCFAGAHFKTGSTLEGGERLSQYSKYHSILIDPDSNPESFAKNRQVLKQKKTIPHKACDVYFFGSDFNWRNGEWGSRPMWHFQDTEIIDYMKNVDMRGPAPWNQIIDTVSETNTHQPPTTLGYFGDKSQNIAFERRLIDESIMCGPFPAQIQPPSLPTFQPVKIKNCPKDLAGDIFRFRMGGGKLGICVRTKGGGNCVYPHGHYWCVTENRPLVWTDEILHFNNHNPAISIVPIRSGMLFMPVPSDHFPVYTRAAVDLDVDNAHQRRAEAEKTRIEISHCNVPCEYCSSMSSEGYGVPARELEQCFSCCQRFAHLDSFLRRRCQSLQFDFDFRKLGRWE